MASAFPLKQLLRVFWQIKNHTLAGFLVLWVLKMALTIGNKLNVEAIFRTYKSNANTTDLSTKLLKTVTVKVLESNQVRKCSYEIAKVVEDSGEGQLFLLPAGARKQLKKLSWSHWQARWVWRLFYINDIIASLQKPKKQYKTFVMNYNTQLCNTAWGKKILARVAKRTRFCSKNRDSNFF